MYQANQTSDLHAAILAFDPFQFTVPAVLPHASHRWEAVLASGIPSGMHRANQALAPRGTMGTVAIHVLSTVRVSK